MSGYSKNLVTLEKMLPNLLPVAEGNMVTWVTAPGAADYFAYKVREAFFVARLHKSYLEGMARIEGEDHDDIARKLHIAEAARRFKVVVVDSRTVKLIPSRGSPEAEVLVNRGATTQMSEDPSILTTINVGLQTPALIQDAWLSAQPSNTPMHFPNADLTYSQLEELHRWTSERHLILIVSGKSLTIQPSSRDMAPFAWSPGSEGDEEVPAELFPFSED